MTDLLQNGMLGMHDAIYDAIEERALTPFCEPCPAPVEWFWDDEVLQGWESKVHHFNCVITWYIKDDQLRVFGLDLNGT
jgi:hypothetical protein